MMHDQERELLEALMRIEGGPDNAQIRLTQEWNQSGDRVWVCAVKRRKVWDISSSASTRVASLEGAIRVRTEAARRRNEV